MSLIGRFPDAIVDALIDRQLVLSLSLGYSGGRGGEEATESSFIPTAAKSRKSSITIYCVVLTVIKRDVCV